MLAETFAVLKGLDRPSPLTKDTFKNAVCAKLSGGMFNCANVYVDVENYSNNFISVNTTVWCLSIDANKNVTVKWTITRNGTVLKTSDVPLTSSSPLAVAGSQLIFSQASYDYTPTVGYAITGTLALSDKMFMSPRISAPTYNGITCGP